MAGSKISIFYDACVVAPNKGTRNSTATPNGMRFACTYGELQRQELVAPLLYPWRYKAKPLEDGQWLIFQVCGNMYSVLCKVAERK